MPLYGDIPGPTGSGIGATGQLAVLLDVGESINLFNNETPTAPAASMAIAVVRPLGGSYRPITFDIEFSAAPTDTLLIQGAMVDTPTAYQALNGAGSSSKQQDFFTDTGNWNFYRVNLTAFTAGPTLRVTAR